MAWVGYKLKMRKYIERKLLKTRFLVNLKFRNLSLRDKIRLVIVLTGLNAGILFTDYQEIAKLLGKRVIVIEIVQADGTVVEQTKTALQVKPAGDYATAAEKSVEEVGNDHFPSPQQPVIELIKKYFPDAQNEALAVFQCESQYQTTRIGDNHLTFQYNGQTYGRSIGVAQVRSGGIERNGKIWVRSDNAKEFEEKMINPEENLKMARKIYEQSGKKWTPWLNCAKKVNII